MGFIDAFVKGISLGSVYAIIALGYTMVYGIAKMLNFAHGDVIMVGAYISYTVMYNLKMPVWMSIVAAVIFCTVLGITIEKLGYKRFRQASASLLQNIALLVFGSNPKMYTSVVQTPPVKLAGGELIITGKTIVTVAVCIVIMIALTLFINKTKPGQAMLAVSEDKGAAQLMGISVNGTIALTFAIGSGLAAVAGVLYLSSYTTLDPYVGSMPGIKAFVAAVLGGIGSIPGAFVGGLLLGLIEILGKTYISTVLSDAIVFGVLIIVLLVKPTGIFGKNIQEKV